MLMLGEFIYDFGKFGSLYNTGFLTSVAMVTKELIQGLQKLLHSCNMV